MILFSISATCVVLLLILSYKQVIVDLNKITILVLPGIINFMLGFSFIHMLIEDSEHLNFVALLTGFITFLVLTSILISNNNRPKEEESNFINKSVLIRGFIVKSHKYYVYIAEIEGFVIFVHSLKQLEIDSRVTLTDYQNNQYFV